MKEQNTLNPLDTCACCALGDSLATFRFPQTGLPQTGIPGRPIDCPNARTPIKTCSILRFTGIQGGPLQEQNTPNPLDTCACRASEGFLGALGSLLAGEPPGWCLKESPSAQHAHVSKGFGVFCSFKGPPWISVKLKMEQVLIGVRAWDRSTDRVGISATPRRPWDAETSRNAPRIKHFTLLLSPCRADVAPTSRRRPLDIP